MFLARQLLSIIRQPVVRRTPGFRSYTKGIKPLRSPRFQAKTESEPTSIPLLKQAEINLLPIPRALSDALRVNGPFILGKTKYAALPVARNVALVSSNIFDEKKQIAVERFLAINKTATGYTLAIYREERVKTEYGRSQLLDGMGAFKALVEQKEPRAKLNLSNKELSDKPIESFCLANGFTKEDLQRMQSDACWRRKPASLSLEDPACAAVARAMAGSGMTGEVMLKVQEAKSAAGRLEEARVHILYRAAELRRVMKDDLWMIIRVATTSVIKSMGYNININDMFPLLPDVKGRVRSPLPRVRFFHKRNGRSA